MYSSFSDIHVGSIRPGRASERRRQRPCAAPSLALLAIAVLLILPSPVATQTLEVGLSDVEVLAQEHSPEWEQFESRFQFLAAGEEALARPADPALGYEMEFLDESGEGIYEHALFVEQGFRMPGLRRSLQARTGSRVQGFALERDRDQARWLAELRKGMMGWAMAQEETQRLQQLRGLVERVGAAAARRADAGEVSGIDLRLLEVSRFQLDVLMEERELERDRMAAEWAARMGLEGLDLQAREGVVGIRAALPENHELTVWLEGSPVLQAELQALESARHAREVEERRRWPGIALMAGYRQMTPDWRGFQLGVSLPLPVRDGNALRVEEARAGERGQVLSLQLHREIQRVRARHALESTGRRATRLDTFPEDLADPSSMLEALAVLYEDGQEPLASVLSSLIVLADGYRAYFEQLERYFDGVFELEALTGRSLLDN